MASGEAKGTSEEEKGEDGGGQRIFCELLRKAYSESGEGTLYPSENFGVLGNLLGQGSVVADDEDSLALVDQLSA